MTTMQILGYSGIGLMIVFAVLALLMVIIMIMRKFFSRNENKAAPEKAAAPVIEAAAAPAVKKDGPRANGSCGGLVLNGVEEKTAAMLMAIVADRLGKPLCELRFISVREIRG